MKLIFGAKLLTLGGVNAGDLTWWVQIIQNSGEPCSLMAIRDFEMLLLYTQDAFVWEKWYQHRRKSKMSATVIIDTTFKVKRKLKWWFVISVVALIISCLFCIMAIVWNNQPSAESLQEFSAVIGNPNAETELWATLTYERNFQL